MTIQWLLSWWNLIFILPFGLGLLYLGLYTVSGVTFGEADMDHDASPHLEVDHDADLSHDVDTDAHLDADTDADADTDGDGHDAEHTGPHASFPLAALGWLGVGRMPLSLVLMVLSITWGTIGFGLNQVLVGRPILQMVSIAVAIAGLVSALVTHTISSILGHYLFNTKNFARRRHELLGSRGEALYPIDSKFGMVCGRDERGEHFEVACRIEDGAEPVAKGSSVQLVSYSAADRMFYVVPADSSVTPRSRA